MQKVPSPRLVVISVVSSFLATVAFASALTQAGTIGFFLIPSSVGFLVTVPQYVYLYNFARKIAQSGPVHIGSLSQLPTATLIYAYILVAVWVVIFFIDILFCVGTAPETPAGIIIGTVVAGLQWIVLGLIALGITHESWNAENELSSATRRTGDQTADQERSKQLPPCVPHYIYLVSFVLAGLSLMFSISALTFLCLANIIAFFATGPYHISSFVVSGSHHRSPLTVFPHPRSVGYALFLVILWCIILIMDFRSYGVAIWQVVLSAIFGGMELSIVAYIAVRCVLESLTPQEGQIQLPV